MHALASPSALRRVVTGSMAVALAVTGLVVFATEASAHDNYVTSTASCISPTGSGATITWLITNDYPLSETGTASTTGDGTLSSGTFSIASSPNYPSDVSTTTLTSTFTAAQLASQLASNPTITFSWSATWSDNYNTSGTQTYDLDSLTNGCVASPTLTTSANPTSASLGSGTLNDSGTLSGGTSPTGTITFYLFSPSQTCSTTPASGSYTFKDAVTVSGNGTYNTTGGPAPSILGTWHWLAVYSGDAGNKAANSGCSSEPVTVSVASPTLTTSANPSSASLGSGTLNDSGTLSGGTSPTGTITFYLFNPSQTCSTTPASGSYTFKDAVTVSGNGTYNTTGGPSPNALGTWHWLAVYSGDTDNNGTNSGCTSEPVVVGKATPTITTSANPTNETVGGGALADSATLSSGSNPTGSITFYLFAPGVTCSASSPSGYAFHQSFTVDGNGSYGPTTGGPSPPSAGTWNWLAVYSGDASNNGANSGCTSEPVTVGEATPTITTSANPTSETVGGAKLNDTGTIAGGSNPTGTVTFYLFAPGVTCSASSPSGYAFSQAVSVDGDGTYDTTGGFSPTSAGTWNWLAVYSGDTNNGGANSGCATEPVTVNKAAPTVTTSANPTSETVGGAEPQRHRHDRRRLQPDRDGHLLPVRPGRDLLGHLAQRLRLLPGGQRGRQRHLRHHRRLLADERRHLELAGRVLR